MGSYVPNTQEERQAMLETAGYESMDDLFRDIPEEVKLKGGLNIPAGLSELEVKRKMQSIAAKNKVFPTIFRDTQRRTVQDTMQSCCDFR